MYIEQAFKSKNNVWRYILGTIVTIVAMFAGQLPLAIAVIFKIGITGDFSAMDEATMMSALNSNLTFFFLLLSFAIALGALLFLVKNLHRQSLTQLTTSRKKIDWSRFWFSFGLIVILNVTLILVDFFFISPENYVLNFNLIPFLILTAIAIVMVPLQTSFEEYFFRGYLMQGIGIKTGYRWIPLVITSVVFGGLHYWNPEVTQMGDLVMVSYIGTGFMLGIMTLMDEGLELPLGFHAANNLVAALLVTAYWTAFNTESILRDVSSPVAGWDVWVSVLVIYPLILLIYAKKYHWKNWGNRLFGKVERPVVNQTYRGNDIEDLSEIKEDY
ncbi:CPBP family intramembrane glutamic endopeptidase [Zunongwangia pacifica]|uniref:CPBP family intramembrane metalloprotease n=1 Tax=Zunongwangia pacifica TaxID=2911062 RepID=A0A9X1ZTG4_9FLAO|nr:CPBP family intramembrane glutamic endopeptidase [Zunongwangia pacifica]MCL6217418.1 CPBP family intramembrane metalloprotease [Zunongwangia pacifica]